MAHITADLVKETTTTTGTGALALGGAAGVEYRTFGSVMANSDTCFYAVRSSGSSEWEIGVGTYSTTGPTLTRTTVVASSNANAAVSFSAGTKDVFLDAPASKIMQQDASGYVTLGNLQFGPAGYSAYPYAILYTGNGLGTTSTGVLLGSSSGVYWTPSDILGVPDTAFARNAAGVVEVNSGTAGQYRDLKLRNLIFSDGTALSTAGQGEILAQSNLRAWL